MSQPVSEYFKKNEADKKAQIMLLKKKRKDELKQQKKNVLESLKDKLTMNDITETVTCSSCKEGYMKRK